MTASRPASTEIPEVLGVHIDGVARRGRGMTRTLMEPWSGRSFARVSEGSGADLDLGIGAAAHAFRTSGWSDAAPLERAAILNDCARAIRAEATALGELEARNVGRPIRETRANAGLAADAFAYFASLTTNLRGASIPMGPGLLDYTVRRPLGVCGLITPWNNPIVLSSWKVAAGLAAGNALVVKPASLTPLSLLRLAELIAGCGLPPGQLNVVTGPGGTLGDQLVGDPRVAKVSFTGSTNVGKDIMRAAAGRLARVSLELGGKSPALVFADADLDAAIGGLIPAMYGNAGQMCTARSRCLVEDVVYDAFLARLIERVAALRLGGPFDEATEVGPLISQQQMDSVLGFVERARADRARVLIGGDRPHERPELRDGFFVRPAVIADVNDEMEIVREEIFGPVLVVDRFRDEGEAIERANANRYGLAATIWTRDLARAHRVANALDVGTVTINTTKVSHVYAPFGGTKQSGIGRELGLEGLDEFLEPKNVIVSVPEA